MLQQTNKTSPLLGTSRTKATVAFSTAALGLLLSFVGVYLTTEDVVAANLCLLGTLALTPLVIVPFLTTERFDLFHPLHLVALSVFCGATGRAFYIVYTGSHRHLSFLLVNRPLESVLPGAVIVVAIRVGTPSHVARSNHVCPGGQWRIDTADDRLSKSGDVQCHRCDDHLLGDFTTFDYVLWNTWSGDRQLYRSHSPQRFGRGTCQVLRRNLDDSQTVLVFSRFDSACACLKWMILGKDGVLGFPPVVVDLKSSISTRTRRERWELPEIS